jgi:hypothetical protein
MSSASGSTATVAADVHAMHAAFVFQLGINLAALNRGDDFLHPAHGRRRTFEHLHAPALRFRVARVHAEEFAGEERRLVAAGAGADLDDHVLLVVRVLGDQQEFQFALHGFPPRCECVLFIVRHLLHLRFVRFDEQLLRLLQAFLDFLPLAIFRHDFRKLGIRLGELLVARGILEYFRRGKLARQLVVAGFDLVEFFEKCQIRHGVFLGCL